MKSPTKFHWLSGVIVIGSAFCGFSADTRDFRPTPNMSPKPGKPASAAGIPVGTWSSDYQTNKNTANKFKGTIMIGPNGLARFETYFEWNASQGPNFLGGKFASLRHLSYRAYSEGIKVSRVGDDLYLYLETGSKDKLIAGDPPGYSLKDYQTCGGLFPEAGDSGNPGTVEIFRIEGNNLVFKNPGKALGVVYRRVTTR